MARLTFNSIFITNSDGSFEPRQRVRIGGVTIGPGARFGSGVTFAGLDLSQYQGRDFEVQIDNDIFVITGIYGQR